MTQASTAAGPAEPPSLDVVGPAPNGHAARRRSDSRPPAVVVGSGVTGLGMVRSLARAGIPCFLLAPRDDIACRSRWARPVPFLRSGWDQDSAEDFGARTLEELLDGSDLEEAVLLPGSDSAVREIAELPRRLTERFRASVPSPDALAVLIDKRAFAAFMRANELPHPRTIELNGPEDLDHVEDAFFQRAFLKPRDSQRFFKRFEVKGIHVRSRDEAKRRLQEIDDSGLSVVLQEYIPGPATSHVFLDGFVDRDGGLPLLLTRRRSRMHPGDFGNSTMCETVPHAEVAPAVESLRRLLHTLSYRGIFSAEVKLDERDGTYRFLEVNARAWWYVEFAAHCGVNVCEAAYRDALAKPVEPAGAFPVGRRLLHPRLDLDAFVTLREEPGGRNGTHPGRGPTAWEWFRPWIGARQALLVADDPWPAVWDLKCRVVRRIRTQAEGRR